MERTIGIMYASNPEAFPPNAMNIILPANTTADVKQIMMRLTM